ncbi:6-aminohexanoate hydrolase [Flavobacterium plurextorum]|uniref:6-aminohexanoate hydrolase n=1 Tax=Flavobacterium plurextorum TaxID=1114867 RepID=A0ABX4CY89_9FLAO|nr:serine hydrolase [Flavobacterium plurextorum]OXB09228.1 6-aminohexanoate hydrolase [Flavobacterium plurextorum]
MKSLHFCSRLLFFVLMFLGVTISKAQEKTKYLDALQSDPARMGWMIGSPPPADRIPRFDDGSFFQFPALRWSVAHMRQFMPTVNVSRGLGASIPILTNFNRDIDKVKFVPLGETKSMTWEESLEKVYADGVIVMHHGKIVYEKYFGALTIDGQHAAMSVTKSFTGTLGIILAKEGLIDTEKTVSYYVPELKNSAFGDATVRQVMDMTTALQFSEDYADPNAEIWKFSAAGNPLPKPKDYDGPRTYYEYLPTVKKKGIHGDAFGYKTVNSDVLGWIIARVTGKSVPEVLSERIWRKIGAEQDGYFSVDAIGTPFAGGGFNLGLRDMARFGQLILNDGKVGQDQIIPKAAIDDIRKGGDKKAFEKAGYSLLKGWSYRNMWWITNNDHGAFCARGVHGQVIYVDPKADMVIVRFASNPVAGNTANDPYSLPAYDAVAKYLLTK